MSDRAAGLWQQLHANRSRTAARRIAELVAEPARAADFSVRLDDMLFDYAKTAIDTEARAALLDLVRAADVEARRDAMFAGDRINRTEGRAVLHAALRNLSGGPVRLDGQDVMPQIRATLARMESFAASVRSGDYAGQGGAFDDVVNIGIGGSDLGPAMACRALAPWHDGPRVHFVSNVDGADIADTLRRCDPARTLFVIASKTFTTTETMTNARTAMRWAAAGTDRPERHFAALSSAEERTAEFGIAPDRVFGFEDWVGGRYSVWGPIGLSLMIAIGPDRFREFLQGAEAMDDHFRTAPLQANMPVMLALTGLWHNQVCGHATRAVLPYDQRLDRLPAYLQQLEMESNGKRVTMQGAPLAMQSGPVVWGAPGTNGQHAFYQLLHQGTQIVPCEFLVAARGAEPDLREHHLQLLANCLAQSKALMRGRSEARARTLLERAGLQGAELQDAAPHRVFPGNRPSTTLIYPQLTPEMLGRIIALYEHRVFVEGVVLGINSFDQFGVELGKELAGEMLQRLQAAPGDRRDNVDGSTEALLRFARDHAPG